MSTNNLAARLKSSAVLIAALVTLGYLDLAFPHPDLPGVWLLPALLFFSLGTAWDVTRLLIVSGRPLSTPICLIATGMVTLSTCVPLLWPACGMVYPVDCKIGHSGWIAVAAVTAVFVVMANEMARYDGQRRGSIERTMAGAFVALYIGMPMAMLVLIRQMHADESPTWGLSAVLSMVAITKSADAGAYFAGKTLGRHKLIPRLSPGKTWEGAVGGMITATIVAALCLRFLIPAIGEPDGGSAGPWWSALVLGPVLMIAGLLGDLAESLIKRDAGAKDSGDWLPGLGGVWDVSDSILAASMPAYVLFAAGLAG
ncbi:MULTISPECIES: phosphatidate cytidylyltransferase [Crateriforma]|uniref:Phosphatidate cytidylyltransferase n=1 Tax=Crateriforma conspicua TaxID=2527996 RepID=A0A5C6FY48_9PLAN|nr:MULTISPECIES: phosphatidate cytidylyltransferase [Crateriforma]TWU66555.1 Phosphatidate cytidylyltransferase [Crateriforma conspicua]